MKKTIVLVSLSLLLSSNLWAGRALMEGIAATNNTVFVDTTNVRLGVGTLTPAASLEVAGPAIIDGTIAARDSTGIGLKDDGGNLGVWVEDGGNVGINTTNPTELLHVYNGNIKTNYGVDAATVVVSGDITFGGTLYGNGANLTGIAVSSANALIDIDRDTIIHVDKDYNDDDTIRFDIAGNEVATLDSSVFSVTGSAHFTEKVGIGTTSPTDPLDIKADSGHDNINLIENSGSEAWQLGIDADGDLNFEDDGTPRITFIDGGNVGIGTTASSQKLRVQGTAYITGNLGVGTAPSSPLTVAGNAIISGDVGIGMASPDEPLHIKADAGHDNIKLTENSGTESWMLGIDADGDLNFDNDGVTAVTFRDSGGRVGIGTDFPEKKLHVFSGSAGSVSFITASDDLIIEHSDSVGIGLVCPDNKTGSIVFMSTAATEIGGIYYNHGLNRFTFSTKNSNALVLDGSQNVGMGTSNPASKLEVAGRIHSTSGGFKFPDNSVQATAAIGSDLKAWCVFSGTVTGSSSCFYGSGVSGVTRLQTGDYRIDFTTPFVSKDSYAMNCTSGHPTLGTDINCREMDDVSTASAVHIRLTAVAVGTRADSDRVHIVVHGIVP